MKPAATVALETSGTPPDAGRERLSPSRVAALVPCHRELPSPELIDAVRAAVGSVLIVDDGVPAPLSAPSDGAGIASIRLPANAGKGHAIAAGLQTILARRPAVEAVLVIDADGQHPPAAIPEFLAAGAQAELVIGNRLEEMGSMPWERRISNRVSTRLLEAVTGQAVRDSQCGMRLLRGRALHAIPFAGGGYEAETRHLKRCLDAGLKVAWVRIPAVYEGAPSSFRRIRDSLRVLAALTR